MKCFFPRSRRRSGEHKHGFSLGCSTSKDSVVKASVERQTQSDPCVPFPEKHTNQTLPQRSSQGFADLRVFSFEELRAATQNFSLENLLGEGGFGCVYKGCIKRQDSKEGEVQQEIAVKQLNRKGQQGHKEWLAEVRFLGWVEHANLVKLVGYCMEDDERGLQRLLVYEFMPNMSLERHLFQNGLSVLAWADRLHIMLGAARGLAYLHEEITGTQVIFRDFKASNVLLDMDFFPKLSDFGMAREGPNLGASHVSTVVVGTSGYVAPEYLQTGHLTAKSDVWSFGVVLVEMLTGRRSVDENRPKNEKFLLDWAKPYLHGDSRVHKIMDPRLEGNYSLVQAQKVASLALRCFTKHQKARPPMSVIVQKLDEIVNLTNLQLDTLASTHRDRNLLGAIKSKSSAISKRQQLLLNDVMSLQNKEDAKEIWRVWAPNAVPG